MEPRDEIQHVRAGVRAPGDLGSQMKQVRQAHHLGTARRVERLADGSQGLEQVVQHDAVLAPILLAPGQLLRQSQSVVSGIAPQCSRHRLRQHLSVSETDEPLRARAQEGISLAVVDEKAIAVRVGAPERLHDREGARVLPERDRFGAREHHLGESALADAVEGRAHRFVPAGARHLAVIHPSFQLRKVGPASLHRLARSSVPEHPGRDVEKGVAESRVWPFRVPLPESKPSDRDGTGEGGGNRSPMFRVREQFGHSPPDLLEASRAAGPDAARGPDPGERLPSRSLPEEQRLSVRPGRRSRQALPGALLGYGHAFARQEPRGGPSLGWSHGRGV